jgi:hypothetical protein
MKDTQLKKDIMNIARAESADEFTICCGTLFTKFNVSVHQQMADNLKTTLQTFFDNRKKNDCNVQMSGPLGTEEEYAYDFVPVVDFRLDGIGI